MRMASPQHGGGIFVRLFFFGELCFRPEDIETGGSSRRGEPVIMRGRNCFEQDAK